MSENLIRNANRKGPDQLAQPQNLIKVLVVVVQFVSSVQGVPGYETITGTTPVPASMRRLSYVIFFFASVFLAVVDSGGGNGG